MDFLYHKAWIMRRVYLAATYIPETVLIFFDEI